MVIVDDRTEAQKKTHSLIVVGTDTVLSDWGQARNGASFAGWACTYDVLDRVHRWVSHRSDMIRVRIVGADYKPRATRRGLLPCRRTPPRPCVSADADRGGVGANRVPVKGLDFAMDMRAAAHERVIESG